MKKISLFLFLLFLAPLVQAQQKSATRLDSVKLHLQELVQKNYVPGIVLGVYENGKTRYYTYGVADKRNGTAVSENTVFEIGSITKTFTTLLAQMLVKEGVVSWDDPVNKYLPDSLKSLEKEGQKVTLRHLASHTAGFPKVPGNLKPKDNYDPYADYTAKDLYAYLNQVPLQTVPGEKINYSNTGVSLLGQVLENATGKTYQSLLRERVLQPLQLESAVFDGANPSYTRAKGYLDGEPVKDWSAKAVAPAGMLDMSAKDLMRYNLAFIGETKTKLYPHMQEVLQVQKIMSNDKGLQGGLTLGWQIQVKDGDTLYWHNGGTGGFRSFTGLMPGKNKAVVILTNTAYDVDPIAAYALGFSHNMPKLRKTADLTESVLKQYIGVYQLAPNFTITVSFKDGQLKAQATNQPAVTIYPESETRFFMKVTDAELEFKKENGTVNSLVLYQNGNEIEGNKIK
ncbi:serine hydrolase [Pontibacter cellulosilyticus]|uniref:Serine hydrolase n=1 Tax=Pontibacter cellulosilyticus TaxID=1720253 RepID=A0A923N8D0_9BACT|nr:serine hydrolase [Pontibacter cellulosilyticus]MBC5992747.1 serine hydrolase [Pontibacter cellulosilyticus]